MTALEIRNLSKTFSGQVVLDRVDLTVSEGEVHALVGQNGSGKSTLIKVLAGYHEPDPGASAEVYGEPLELGSADAAFAANVRFVHQDLGLVLGLSVLDNLMLGRRYPTRGAGRIDWAETRREAFVTMARVGLGVDVDLRAPVGALSLADRTRLAIGRALPEDDGRRAVIVLDEPTASLPAHEVEQLFETIRLLRQHGNAVVLVSHHLDEVLAIADTITVLRDGKQIAAVAARGQDQSSLTRLIIGRDLVRGGSRDAAATTSSAPRGLIVDHVGGGSVRDVSFDVGEGEVLGVAGLAGSGREVLGALLTGRLPRTGTVRVGAVLIPGDDPAAALRSGMAWVTGERARYGVFANLDVRPNMTMGTFEPNVRHGRLSHAAERAEVRQWIEDLGVVTRGADVPITSLSGGNQQKVLVARALRRNPTVLVLDDPTAGIDVGAREQVHAIVDRYVRERIGVVLISTDTAELTRLCDRVLVLSRGTVLCELRRGVDLDAATIDHAQVSGATIPGEDGAA